MSRSAGIAGVRQLPPWKAIGGVLFGYVLLSSWLGLTQIPFGSAGSFPPYPPSGETHGVGPFRFFVDTWSDSLLADTVFALATLVLAVGAFLLMRRIWRSPLGAAAAAVPPVMYLANWIVYALSFSYLSDARRTQVIGGGDAATIGTSMKESFQWTLSWGAIGLWFTALAASVALLYIMTKGAAGPRFAWRIWRHLRPLEWLVVTAMLVGGISGLGPIAYHTDDFLGGWERTDYGTEDAIQRAVFLAALMVAVAAFVAHRARRILMVAGASTAAVTASSRFIVQGGTEIADYLWPFWLGISMVSASLFMAVIQAWCHQSNGSSDESTHGASGAGG